MDNMNKRKTRKRKKNLCGDDVVEMHMRIAFADMNDYVEYGTDGPDEGKRNVVRLKNSGGTDGAVVAAIYTGGDNVSVKLADKQKSLAFLAKYFDLFPMDKHRRDYDNKRLEAMAKKKPDAGEEAAKAAKAVLDALNPPPT